MPAALRAADVFGDVRDVDEGVFVEQRVIVRDDDDVGAAAALDRRREARLDVVLIDALDGDLRTRLSAELLRLLLEHLVGGWDEVRPLQEVQSRSLGEYGRGARGGERAGGGDFHEVATAEAADGHAFLPGGDV